MSNEQFDIKKISENESKTVIYNSFFSIYYFTYTSYKTRQEQHVLCLSESKYFLNMIKY